MTAGAAQTPRAIRLKRVLDAAGAVVELLDLDDEAAGRVAAALEVALLDRCRVFPTLPPGPAGMLAGVIAAGGATVSYGTILDLCNSAAQPKALHVYASRIRQALPVPEWLVNEHSVGYRWAGPGLEETKGWLAAPKVR